MGEAVLISISAITKVKTGTCFLRCSTTLNVTLNRQKIQCSILKSGLIANSWSVRRVKWVRMRYRHEKIQELFHQAALRLPTVD